MDVKKMNAFNFKDIFSEIPDAVILYDSSLLLASNKRACELLGYGESDLEGINLSKIMESDAKRLLESFLLRKDDFKCQSGETSFRRKNGEYLHVEFSTRRFAGSEKEVIGLLSFRDLGASRTIQAKLLDNMHGMVYRCLNDENWTMEYVSAGAKALTGYRPDEIQNNRAVAFASLIHPEDRQRVWSEVQAGLNDFRTFDIQYRIADSAGKIKWVSEQGTGIYSENGDLIALEGLITDVSEMVIAGQEAMRAQAFLKMAIEQSPSGILIADAADGRIICANSAAMAIMGAGFEELMGSGIPYHCSRNWKTFYPDGETPFPADKLPLYRATLDGAVSSNVELMIKKNNGENRILSANAGPVRDESGKIIAGIVVFTDITEQRKLEKKFRQSEKMEAIGQLAGGIAHDFNNQLMGIMGYAESLLDTLSDGAAKEDLNAIIQIAGRAADLTKKLLAFSRKGKYMSVTFDMHTLVDETAALLSRSIDKRIVLTRNLLAEDPKICGDPTQIQNAVLNLAINSRDAMPGGGEIVFETKNVIFDENAGSPPVQSLRPGKYLKLSVADNGTGMTENVKRQIFDPFFTTKPNGTGMGLPSVYGTVTSHGGVIEMESVPGSGTIFSIFLPLASAPTCMESRTASASVPLKSASLLLVDDDPTVRIILARMFVTLGHKVAACANGPEAIELFRKKSDDFDLVILDMNMPMMDGRETFLELKRIKPSVKALIISGFTDDANVKHLLADGAVGVIQKPFNHKEIARIIAESA